MAFSEQPLRRLDPQLGSKCHVVVNSDCDSPHFGLHSPQVQPSESIGITIRPGEMSTWVSNTCEEPGLFQMARSELLAWPTRRDRQSGCLIILGLVSDRCRTAKLSPSSSLVKSESDDDPFHSRRRPGSVCLRRSPSHPSSPHETRRSQSWVVLRQTYVRLPLQSSPSMLSVPSFAQQRAVSEAPLPTGSPHVNAHPSISDRLQDQKRGTNAGRWSCDFQRSVIG